MEKPKTVLLVIHYKGVPHKDYLEELKYALNEMLGLSTYLFPSSRNDNSNRFITVVRGMHGLIHIGTIVELSLALQAVDSYQKAVMNPFPYDDLMTEANLDDIDGAVIVTASRIGKNGEVEFTEFREAMESRGKTVLTLYSSNEFDEETENIKVGYIHNRFDVVRRRDILTACVKYLCGLYGV